MTIRFDRDQAVYYAHTYAYNPNPGYPNFSNDCTNFVSQCWAAAGIPTTTEWHCIPPNNYTNTWIRVEEFAKYMQDNGYCRISYSSNDAQLGDVIQFYNPRDGWHHSTIITIAENGILSYSQHTPNTADKPLSSVYPSSGEQIRFLCVYNF